MKAEIADKTKHLREEAALSVRGGSGGGGLARGYYAAALSL